MIADIAAQPDVLYARIPKQVGGKGGCCALSIGAGNADYLCGAQFEEDVYLRGNEFIIPACDLEKFIIFPDGGIGYDNVGPPEIIRVVQAQMEFYIRKFFELVYGIV